MQQLKSSTLFEAIQVGIYREDVSLDRKILDREDKSNNASRSVETDKHAQTTSPKNKEAPQYKKQDLPSLRYDDVKHALNSTVIESIFREYAPRLNPDGQIKKQGTQISCGSLNINLSKGLWYRFSDGSKGDIFALVSEASGVQRREALEIVAGFAGVQKTTTSSIYTKSAKNTNPLARSKDPIDGTTVKKAEKTEDSWIAYDKVPHNAPTFNPKKDLSFMIKNGGDITNIYEYKDAEGKLAGYTVRVIDRATGKKKVQPVAYCMNEAKQQSRWQSKGFLVSGYKPIYKAEVLREKPTERVLIVEGEKTADSAAKLFPEYAVISWMGGVGSIGSVNWSELKDREVVVWPDNDEPGKIAANKIIEEIDKVNGFNGLAKTIDTEFLELEEKWDLADALPAHLPQGAIQKIVKATFAASYTSSQVLGEGIANNKIHEKALDALDMLVATGRIDREDVPSKAIYKSTLAAIAVSKGIDLEKSETFVEDVRGLQDTYQEVKNNYERSISLTSA